MPIRPGRMRPCSPCPSEADYARVQLVLGSICKPALLAEPILISGSWLPRPRWRPRLADCTSRACPARFTTAKGANTSGRAPERERSFAYAQIRQRRAFAWKVLQAATDPDFRPV